MRRLDGAVHWRERAAHDRPLDPSIPPTLTESERANARAVLGHGIPRGDHGGESFHRRRSGHHRPADQGQARGRLGGRASEPAARSAQGRGGQAQALRRGGRRHPVPARRGGEGGGASDRCDGGGRAARHRRLLRSPGRARLDLRISGACRGPGRGDRLSAESQQSRLSRDRRDRDPAPARGRGTRREGRGRVRSARSAAIQAAASR